MNKFFFLLFTLSLPSCAIVEINGTFQGLFSYYKKTKDLNPNLFINYNDTILKSNFYSKNNKIVVLTGKNLLSEIKSHKKVLVYNWDPKCRGKFCPDLSLLQRNCKTFGIELYVVAEYYDLGKMEKDYNLKYPILGIDNKHYKSNLTLRYLKLFYNDLTNRKYDKKNFDKLYYFENGYFIKKISSIDNIN